MLWKERRLPVNVDPLASNLDDPLERDRIAKILQRGLNAIVGYALPIRPRQESGGLRWESGRWFFRDEQMFLIPGDSPMGLRLPLDSLPWLVPEDRPVSQERDPFDPRGVLPSLEQLRTGAWSRGNGAYSGQATDPWGDTALRRRVRSGRNTALAAAATLVPQYAGVPDHSVTQGGEPKDAQIEPRRPFPSGATGAELPPEDSPQNVIRTALCVEPREGRVHVFMPPIVYLEEYLSLVAVVEDTAAELGIPVRVEGYPPPHDHRLQHFKITPDPGVIEVNIQPAFHWDELAENTTGLYEEARLARLGTEKFLLDGRHTGTGGGNHLVLGGPTAADSPFLRRPDLLRSLVAYWNNRPSLSYLFSGLFVGPTSQAPRVDEARHESLCELEIAFGQLLPENEEVPPWLVDQLFRHLLVNVTGNAHRAEFCIDKLFSPDSAGGRLGLVEFRTFEMPPHSRMSLTQQLLLRALVARFWREPYRQPLVRWGTSLHDRFMLPHFVVQDFHEVLQELEDFGLRFDREWFAPHVEFRFPLNGEVTYDGIHLELRQAIEPWNVLGEEAAGAGTARYVDSSVERLQVKVRGLTDPRFLVACNGRRVPLHPTGVRGEFVAGVRYRAWQPPSCLHPTLGLHTPLVFDLFDLWSRRSIGGCTWHVAHPGGRHFETFPVNAYEAESRRAARFSALGHTGGQPPIPTAELNREYPMTLDLRRP